MPAYRDAHGLMHVMHTPTRSHTRAHRTCALLSAPMSLRSSANLQETSGVGILRLQINGTKKHRPHEPAPSSGDNGTWWEAAGLLSSLATSEVG